MSETLVVRVKRLLSGSVNGLAGNRQAAAAETAMREAIREIACTIDDLHDALANAIVARHRAYRSIALSRTKINELVGMASVAVNQNRDDLAEAAIARQIDIEAQIPVLQDTLKEASGRQLELEGYIAALAGRKRELEQEVAALQDAATPCRGSVAGAHEIDCSAAARLNEMARLMRSTDVNSRLAALKALKRAG
jgi:phage shock protein A